MCRASSVKVLENNQKVSLKSSWFFIKTRAKLPEKLQTEVFYKKISKLFLPKLCSRAYFRDFQQFFSKVLDNFHNFLVERWIINALKCILSNVSSISRKSRKFSFKSVGVFPGKFNAFPCKVEKFYVAIFWSFLVILSRVFSKKSSGNLKAIFRKVREFLQEKFKTFPFELFLKGWRAFPQTFKNYLSKASGVF